MSGAAPGAGRGRLVVAATALLFALPVLLDLALSGARHVFDYLASDSYYYFVIARNLARAGSLSFDGSMPTNGFHPVWQALCALCFLVGRALEVGDLAVVVAILLASVGLITTGLVALACGLRAAGAGPGWGYATLPVGAYALLVLPLWLVEPGAREPVYGTLHSYVNGMESALLLCAYGLCAAWYLGGRALADDRGAVVQGLLLALLGLARLDALVTSAAVLLSLVAEAREPGARRRLGLCALAFVLPIALYLVANRVCVGAALPVSGSLKTSFPVLHAANLERLLDCVRAPRGQSLYRVYRLAQLILPALAAVAQLLAMLRPARPARARLCRWMGASAVGVLAISAYDLGFVELAEQGPWYHPLGTLYFSLWSLLALAGLRARPAGLRETWLGLAGVGALSLWIFVEHGRGLTASRAFADFYFEGAPRLRAFYGASRPRFIEVDDGIFGFATGYATLSGKGLALDPVAAGALRRGELLPLALERGFDRITSVLYMSARGLDTRTSSERACRLVSGIVPKTLCEELDYSIEYVDRDFGVVRVRPLDAGPRIDSSAPRP